MRLNMLSAMVAMLGMGAQSNKDLFNFRIRPESPFVQRSSSRNRKWRDKPEKKTYSFVRSEGCGYGLFKCRQTGATEIKKISRKGLSVWAQKHFGMQ